MEKRCQICGKVIATDDDMFDNYYRYIRVKYCDDCRQMMYNIQHRAAVKKNASYQKLASAAKDETIKNQRDEIEKLKDENQRLRNMVEKLRK